MKELRVTNVLLTALLALELWQILTPVRPAVADKPQDVRVVDHDLWITGPLPVVIKDK